MSQKVKTECTVVCLFSNQIYTNACGKKKKKKKVKYPEEQTQLHISKPLILKKLQLPYLPAAGTQAGKIML